MLIKNNPAYNEAWPRAVVPYQAVHGVRRTGHAAVAAERRQRARAIAGRHRRTDWSALRASTSARAFRASCCRGRTPSMAWMPSTPARTASPATGAARARDAGKYSNTDIWAVRVVAHGAAHAIAATARTSAARFTSHAEERLRILGEIPLRKFNGQRPADSGSRRQSGHQFSGQARRRYAVHVPDARPQRHGAEHGADLASGAAGRVARRLRWLSCAQPAAAGLRRPRPRSRRVTRCLDLERQTPTADARMRGGHPGLRVENTGADRASSSCATSVRCCKRVASAAIRAPNPRRQSESGRYRDRQRTARATIAAWPPTSDAQYRLSAGDRATAVGDRPTPAATCAVPESTQPADLETVRRSVSTAGAMPIIRPKVVPGNAATLPAGADRRTRPISITPAA